MSPLDHGNLNRAFPGDPDGGPTWKIADYLQNHLVPKVEVVADFHCGGGSLAYRPHASTHFAPDASPELKARSLAAVKSVGLRHVMIFETAARACGMSTATRKHGAIYINGEYGGTGARRPRDPAGRRRRAAPPRFLRRDRRLFEPLPLLQWHSMYSGRAPMFMRRKPAFSFRRRSSAIGSPKAISAESFSSRRTPRARRSRSISRRRATLSASAIRHGSSEAIASPISRGRSRDVTLPMDRSLVEKRPRLRGLLCFYGEGRLISPPDQVGSPRRL